MALFLHSTETEPEKKKRKKREKHKKCKFSKNQKMQKKYKKTLFAFSESPCLEASSRCLFQ